MQSFEASFTRVTDKAIRHERMWQERIREMAEVQGIVVDLGGGTPHQGYIKKIDLGPATQYVCIDVRLSAQPTLVADGAYVPLASASVSGILCNAVLEHVPDPQSVVAEIYRILQPEGWAYVGVPFIYPYHDQIDFFRFSDSALDHMFKRFQRVELVPVGDYFFVALLFLTGFNFRLARLLSPILHLPRGLLRLALVLSRLRGSSDQGKAYLRSLDRSPVGWYIYAQK